MKNRKEIENSIVASIASMMTKEQQQTLMELIHRLNDEQFEKMLKLVTNDNDNIEDDIIFYNNAYMTFMNSEANKNLWDSINKSKPTDIIVSDEETNNKLSDIWCKKEKSGIPSDIFFMNTIPIMDMYIDIKLDIEVEKTFRNRIVIFPNYQNLISNNDNSDDPVTIGAIVSYFDYGSIVTTIDVLKGSDYVMSGIELGYKNISENTKKRISSNLKVTEIQSVMSNILSAWYGIQISCLHPTIKEVFSKGRTSVLEDANKRSNSNNKNKKKKIKYIKRHYITIDDINDKLNNNSYNRKSLCWYVTGHWRTYKNGKKVFIKPYWKGILRESKNTEIRERIVDTTVNID